jgi:hypothetical protein
MINMSTNKILNSALSLTMKVIMAFGVVGMISVAEAQNGDPQNLIATYDRYIISGRFVDLIKLEWNHSSTGQPNAYRIYRSKVGGQSCQESNFLYQVEGSAKEVYDWSINEIGREYFYTIRAVSSSYPSVSETNCSNISSDTALGLPYPLEPLNVSATINLYNGIDLTWNLPPSNSRPIVRWGIFRTEDQSARACNSQSRPAFFVDANTVGNFYLDRAVDPGKIYSYSVIGYTSDDNASFCSENVSVDGRRLRLPPPVLTSASQGDFEDKVEVRWTPPIDERILVGQYRIHRGTDCSGEVLGQKDVEDYETDMVYKFDHTGPHFESGRIYNYSISYTYNKNTHGEHGVVCSNTRSGHARLRPPVFDPALDANVGASDGEFPSHVAIRWKNPESTINVTGFRLYPKSNNCSGTSIEVQFSDGLGIYQRSDNTNIVPGIIYGYSVKSISSVTGVTESSCVTDPGHASLPPVNLTVAPGTFPSQVVVSWNPPSIPSDFEGYGLFRGPNCQGSVIHTFPANTVNRTYTETVANLGQEYTYSIKLVPSSSQAANGVEDGPCTTNTGYLPLGAPETVNATDGTFTDKVQVTWAPVPNAGKYIIFRGSACTGRIGESNVPSFDDVGAVPGRQYVYSVRPVSFVSQGEIQGACSLPDPGHASILPPPLQVVISTTPKGLVPTWTKPPGDITGYELYRSENPGDRCAGTEIASPSVGTVSHIDENIERGKVYYYSILATSPVGNSACSQAVSGLIDQEALLSPAFAKFNTYLGQQNFAELINQGTKSKPVRISIFNLRGELMTELSVVVKAKEQVDININERIQFACNVLQRNCEGFEDLSATVGAPNGLGRPDGVVDTYGLVRFEFDDSDPLEKLVGRMSFYRSNTNGSYSFAFAREFRNPITGNGYGVSNTYDPRGMGFLVPNWAELISFGIRNVNGDIDLQPLGYTVNIYDQEGVRKLNRHVVLQPLGEIDIHGGHEFVNAEGKVLEGVYLVEVIPDNPKAEYSLSIARYSSNAPPATDPETYNYAFVAEGNKGSTSPLYAPIGNTIEGVLGVSDKLFADNWVEIACISSQDCEGLIRFVSSTGKETAGQFFKIRSKSQFHFNASALLDPKSTGSVHVVPLAGMIIGQSMTYLHGGENDLQSAFVSPARTSGIKVQSGSINTFLGMQNVLNAFSTANTFTEASYEITSFSGGFFQGVLALGGESVSSLRISDNSSLNFPSNTYGAMILTTESETNSINAEVRRVRVLPDGKIDFVMPTLMK